MNDRDVRVFDLKDVEIRQVADGLPEIVGYAAVYGRESSNMGGFIEIIETGFFENALDGDIRALWNHNSDLPLGRTQAGTLFLRDDAQGLYTRTLPPNTSYGRDAIISIERGDVTHMSFSFQALPTGEHWYVREDGEVVRRLLKGGCKKIFDISPVVYPAYEATRVDVRCLNKAKELARAGQINDADDGGSEDRARLDIRRRRLNLLKEQGK